MFAALHNDQHCIKMILESTQLLMTALHTHAQPDWQDKLSKVYKATHKHHPCALWVQETPQNFVTLLFFALALCAEYTMRMRKKHACEALLRQMLHVVPTVRLEVPWKPTTVRAQAFSNCTPVPLCMPEKYHVVVNNKADLLESYRKFYIAEKLRFNSGRLSTYRNGVPALFRSPYNKIVNE